MRAGLSLPLPQAARRSQVPSQELFSICLAIFGQKPGRRLALEQSDFPTARLGGAFCVLRCAAHGVHVPTGGDLASTILPTPEALSLGRQRKLRIGIGIVAVILTIGLAIGLGFNGIDAFLLVTASIVFALWFPRDYRHKRAVAGKAVRELSKQYEDLQTRYASDCTEQSFQTKVKELNALRGQYDLIPVMRKRKLQELERNKYQLQLHDFLDRFDLNDASIPSIGPGRKAMLASYGIDTAADVSYGAITQVPGIGPKYATKLLAWRQSVESRFHFDPKKAIAQSEIEKVDREIRDLRAIPSERELSH